MRDAARREDDHDLPCGPQAGRVRGFIRPWLLLMLARRPAHGYELMERLGHDEDIPTADPGLLYRTLRQFEESGLVKSEWDTGGGGPARRVYHITAAGRECLRAWVVHIRQTRQRLNRFLTEYESQSEPEACDSLTS